MEEAVPEKEFHWKIPAIAVGIAGIIAFFLLSLLQQLKSPIYTMEERQIVTVLSASGEEAPFSRWQLGVKVTKEEEQLQRFNQLFENLQPVEEALGEKELRRTLRIFYSDGTSEVWQDLSNWDGWVFFSVEHQQYYLLSEKSPNFLEFAFFEYWDPALSNGLWIMACILLLGFLQRYLHKKIKVTSENIDQEGPYSTKWQRVNMVCTLILIAVLIFKVPLLDFQIIVLIAFTSFILNILLENYYGKNSWRKWSLLGEMVNTILVFYILFVNWPI